MEVLPSYSAEKLKNSRRVPQSFVMKPSENFASINNNNIHGGLLFAPPPSIYFSYPPPAALMNPLNQNHQLSGQQQPPLLPLPNSQPLHRSLPARIKPISSSPPNRKTNRNNNQSLALKKSKSKPIASKSEEPKKDPKLAEVDASAKPIDRDLKKSPKDMLKRSLSSSKRSDPDDLMKDLEISPGSGIFTLSPPPSSLPLPKFALRPKLNCKAEAAAGVDTGASDDLRRMLRLH